MSDIRVVHLVWAPLGTEPLERFVASYRRHAAGADHRLLVLFNGFRSRAALAPALAALDGVEHDGLYLARRVRDLTAYRDATRGIVEGRVCFLNSHAELLAGGWLAKLTAPLDSGGVGLAGATGSWESGVTPAPPYMKPGRALRFRPFPSPHVRTNAFTLATDLAAELRWGPARTKSQAWAVENGRRSLTNQVRARGLEVRVVDRHGNPHDVAGWPASRTFRASEQEDLLVADNQTRAYAEASPEQRRALSRLAWGDAVT
jgi:hypothetical protein